MPPELFAAVSLLLGAASALVAWRGAVKLRDTTLFAPAVWSGVSLALVALAQAMANFAGEQRWMASLEFFASVATFCPMMAILGAKRPQNVAWQWIVLSLWVVLALPAAETLLLRPSKTLYVAPAWSWLMLILLALEAMNYLPTRYWPSTMLALVGQWLLLSAHLPGEVEPLFEHQPLAALACLSAAIMLVAAGWPAGSRPQSSWDRVWLDFRNAYGAAWGLRIAQRLQETARQSRWPLTITWQQLELHDEQALPAEEQRRMAQAVESLLWRFVSPDWIARRRHDS